MISGLSWTLGDEKGLHKKHRRCDSVNDTDREQVTRSWLGVQRDCPGFYFLFPYGG
jgi:hypothetical protein